MRTATMKLPDETYAQLKELAKAHRQTTGEVVARALRWTLPVDRALPEEVAKELRALEALSDDVLWAVARSKMDPARQRRWSRLLAKNQRGALTQQERQELDRMTEESQRLTLYKARAHRLLKSRGQAIPASGRPRRRE